MNSATIKSPTGSNPSSTQSKFLKFLRFKRSTKKSSASKLSSANSPIYSLVKLQTVKKKPELQSYSYREAVTLNNELEASHDATLKTSLPSIQRKKVQNNFFESLTSRKAHTDSKRFESELDPSNLSAVMLSHRAKAQVLPPEKRLIIVDNYLAKAQNPTSSVKNLDNLWHQTLGDNNHALSKLTAEDPAFSVTSPSNSYSRKRKNSLILRRKEIAPEPTNRFDEPSPFPKDETAPVHKNVEILYHCVKDYAKLIAYSQKAVEQSKAQQTGLHDFVMTFVGEIDYVEKTPTKDFNAERLRTFQFLIESKFQEILSQQDLLLDQIQHVYDAKSYDIQIQTENRLSSRPTLHTQQQLQSPPPLNLSRIEPNASLSFTLSSTLDSKVNPDLTLDRLQHRTDTLKEEVRQYQEERLESQKQRYREKIHSALHRVTSAGIPVDRTPSSNSSVVGQQSSGKVPTALRTSSGPSYLRFVNTNSKSPYIRAESSLVVDKSSEIASEVGGEDTPFEEEKGRRKVKLQIPDSNEDIDDENSSKVNQEERKNSQRELQIWFTAIVEEFESHITRFKNEMKIFLRHFNPEESEAREVPQTGKLISMQAQTCVEVINEYSGRYTKDYMQKKQDFIQSEIAIFHNIEEIIRANILKLASLKNLIGSSIRRLLDIQEYRKKLTPVDLTDSDVQTAFRKNLEKMKKDLNKDRDAILFIAHQIAKDLPTLQSIEFLNLEFLDALVKRMKNITRSIPFLLKLSQIDEDYTRFVDQSLELLKKTDKQVNEVKKVTEDELAVFIPNTLYESVENLSKETASLKKAIGGLRNELNHYKAFTFFSAMLESPLVSSEKMLLYLTKQENRIEEYVKYLKSLIMKKYYTHVKEKETFEVTFNTFIAEDLAKHQSYLRFEDWEKNAQKVQAMQERIEEIKTSLRRFHEEKYSHNIVLLPKPIDVLAQLDRYKSLTDMVIQLLNQGKVMNVAHFNEYFKGVNSETLRERAEALRDEIAVQIREKELVVGSPLVAEEPLHSISVNCMQLLVILRNVLKKTLQLCDTLNNYYIEFAFAFKRDPANCTEAMRALINGVRGAYQGFIAGPIEAATKEHPIFTHFKFLIKESSNQELDLLNRLNSSFDAVENNHLLFEEELQDINQPYKFFNVLDKWAEKHAKIQSARDKMNPVLINLQMYQDNSHLRQELLDAARDYTNTQAIMLNSIDSCLAFLEIGKTFNQKSLASNLTARLRYDRSGIIDFLYDLEEIVGALRMKLVKSKGKIEKNFEALIENVMDTVVQTLECLKVIDENYSSLPSRLEKFRDRDPTNYVAVMTEAVTALKEMEKVFTVWIDGLEIKMMKKCGVTIVIRSFLTNVLSKDVKVCEKLLIEAKIMEAFLDRKIKAFFLEDLTKGQFRNLSTRDIREIEMYREKCEVFANHAGGYLLSAEILERIALKYTVQSLQDLFEGLRTTLQVFCVFYKEGLEYVNLANKIFNHKFDANEILNHLQSLEDKAQELIRAVAKARDARRYGDLIEDRILAIGLRSIIQDDILAFFEEARRWALMLRKKLLGMVTFDRQMKNAYDGRVVLYQDEWIRFVKDLIPSIQNDLSMVVKSKSDYDELKEKMAAFTEQVTKEFIEMKEKSILEVIKAVTVLNSRFLTEKFFQMDRRDKTDLVIPKLMSFSEKMKEMRLEFSNAERKMVKYVKVCDDVLEAIDYLAEPANLKSAGFESVMRIEAVMDYVDVHGLRVWRDLMSFLLQHGNQLANKSSSGSNFLKEVEAQMNITFFGKHMDMVLGYYYTKKQAS